jgi:hypothetical protein
VAGQALVVSASADGSVRVWSSSWACLRIFSTPMNARGGAPMAPGDVPGSPTWRFTAAALSSTATRSHAIAGGRRDGALEAHAALLDRRAWRQAACSSALAARPGHVP